MKWITATQLEQWAATLPARSAFPGLIADLIWASALKITSMRFPMGDKGQVRGFDGILQASGGAPPFVPDGHSIWEFGVTDDVVTKANQDFEKRTKEIEHAQRMQTTFVFATPRTWDRWKRKKREDWLKEKRDLKLWKEVEFHDGPVLESWLDTHPAVSSFHAKSGISAFPPSGAFSTDEFWEKFSARFEGGLVEEVLLCGREAQAQSLLRNLCAGGNALSFAADSPDEVIAFVVAAIRTAEPVVRAFLEARTIVVDSEEAAHLLARKSDLIYLPRRQARNQAAFLSRHGLTVFSAGADEILQLHKHERLARPSSAALGKALMAMGHSESEGYQRARACGRSLTVLARQIPNGPVELAEWLPAAEAVMPALLAGGWSASTPSDMAVMCELGGKAHYEQIEGPLRPLVVLKDPPIDRVEDVWKMRSSVDAFMHLGHLIGAEHLQRFEAAAIKVFGRIIPPPNPHDVFKLSATHDDSHSNWLREGMMTTLLHIATLHDQAHLKIPGTTPQNFVDKIVRTLPGLSSDYRLLASLDENLALLAEAAPDPFLEALEQLLEGDSSAILPIFSQDESFLAPRSPHIGLLWALEVLAWDPVLLMRVATCLARLAAIDPGVSNGNNPLSSLRSIFLPWSPNTNANLKQRMGALTHVVVIAPSIAWPLLVKLLPRHHDHTSTTSVSRFREAGASNVETLTYNVVWEAQGTIIDMALEHAHSDAARLIVLIEAMGQFQLSDLSRTLDRIEEFLSSAESEDGLPVWDALFKESKRHRKYGSADWTVKGDALLRMEAMATKYQPSKASHAHAWLFDDYMPDIEPDAETPNSTLDGALRARSQAVASVLSEGGVTGLIAFISQVKQPHLVLETLRHLELPVDDVEKIVNAALTSGANSIALATALTADGIQRFGEEWVKRLRHLVDRHALEPEAISNLLMMTKDERSTWNLARSFGDAVEDFYWKKKHSFFVDGAIEDLVFATEKYLRSGRPMAAIRAAQRRLNDMPTELLLKLLDAAVAEINASNGADSTMTSYYIEKAFDSLEGRSDATLEKIAAREFAYLPLLHHRKTPLSLHKLLLRDPATYVAILCKVFKASSGETPELSPEQQRFATAAYDLLSGLRTLPGQQDNRVDADELRKWCDDVRVLSANDDRAEIADLYIGHLLAHAPADPNDQCWPHTSVRMLIEHLQSETVEDGILVERFNLRGVHTRAIGEGGVQERVLADHARAWAAAAPAFPRTSAMLFKLAESWDHHAERADIQAQKDALRH